jgi:chemotaxis protein methyltransferase CheR
MVRTRLARRLRQLGLADFDAYCALIEGPDGAEEIPKFISALTTNVSHFFREAHHFELLRSTLIPAFRQKIERGHPVRIWSAGCANGQEPYSIAMVLTEAGLTSQNGCRILATDIDPAAVAFARSGQYPEHMLSGLAPQLRADHFRKTDGQLRVADTLRDLATFRVLNLLRDWPMRGKFDAIFCRNVVIYFDQPTQTRLWTRFAEILEPGGHLFLGHSERISPEVEPYFEKAGVTAYRRTALENAELKEAG